MDPLPILTDLGKHLVMAEPLKISVSEMVIAEPAFAPGQVTHFCVEHGNSRGRVLEQRFEKQLVRL